jgi:hypothetical protein
MQVGTVMSYSEDKQLPRAEVALPNGDHIRLTLDRNGLAIARIGSPEHFVEMLFQAGPNIASRICAGLFKLETTPKPAPLRIFVAAVVQLGSAEEVSKAFREAAAQAL